MNEDDEWVATFDETVSFADAHSRHFPRKRYKAVRYLQDFKIPSIESVSMIDTVVFQLSIMCPIDVSCQLLTSCHPPPSPTCAARSFGIRALMRHFVEMTHDSTSLSGKGIKS